MSQAGSHSKEHGLLHEVLGHSVLPAIPGLQEFHTKCGTPAHTAVYTYRHVCSEGTSPGELLLPELLLLEP